MKNDDLKITYVNPDLLIANPDNAKIHTDEQVNQIKKSIIDFGFNDPIAVDENYHIIEGHGRLLAAKQLELKELPIIVLSGLTDEQKTAYALVHNKLTNNTGFDFDILKQEMQAIKSISMDEYGFDIAEKSWFDQNEIPAPEKALKIYIEADEETACNIRTYLDKNKIKYKEK